MAVFEYLRISLAEPKQQGLFDTEGKAFQQISRREYLEKIFSSDRIDFRHRGGNYSFVRDGMYGDILAGRIGKQVIEPVHKGPEQNFAVEMSEEWKPTWVFIDFSSKSQLAVVQVGIASPKPLLRSLFNKIETFSPSLYYESFIEYVSERQDFWWAVEEYAGRLTRLEFTFVPPNALGLEERIKEIVKAAESVGADTTKFVHASPSGGLKPEGEYVDAALNVTTEGAGSVLLKAGKKTVFSSEKNKKTIDIVNEDIPEQKNVSAIQKLINLLKF